MTGVVTEAIERTVEQDGEAKKTAKRLIARSRLSVLRDHNSLGIRIVGQCETLLLKL